MAALRKPCACTRTSVGVFVLVILLAAGPAALAQDASVVYLEGSPTLKQSSGGRGPLDFGDSLHAGDSVLTGRRDFVELEQAPETTIRVQPDTVFTVQERERDGERESVMKATVGAVRFKFDRLLGRNEPTVGTDTTVAGVRGTELTVYAGTDGASLFLVEAGEVQVDAAEGSVVLGRNEAVEVSASGVAGEKYVWPGRELDFSSWDRERIARFLENPVEGVERIRERMEYFQQQIQRYYPQYLEGAAEIRRIRDEIQDIREEQGDEAAREYSEDHLEPLLGPTRAHILNTRYYALSALSLRRFVVGRMYMHVKTRYILEPDNATYQEFLSVYAEILTRFEQVVSPRLVAADI